jgi:RNA polymerase sigma-70 factor (ECF subfamily)
MSHKPAPEPAAVAVRDRAELAWLQATALGDRSAFEKLYRDYHPRLARFLSRVTQRDDLIGEVINDVFWIVWRKAAEFRGQSLVSTWIMGIAYRCALKALRDAGALPAEEPLLPVEAADDSEALLIRAEQRSWILQGIEKLPADQRTTLVLTYYLGHSCEEIAVIMDCAVGTVKARLFHARVKLRNLLPLLGGADDGAAHARR